MIPKPGDNVEIFLRNGIKFSGIVSSWSDGRTGLESESGLTVIQKTLDDVMFYKIKSEKKSSANFAEKLSKKIDELKSEPISSKEQIETIAKLKCDLIEEEKKSIREKLNSHEIKETKQVQYELPNFFKKPSSVQHSSKESSRKTNSDNSILRSLFPKKD